MLELGLDEAGQRLTQAISDAIGWKQWVVDRLIAQSLSTAKADHTETDVLEGKGETMESGVLLQPDIMSRIVTTLAKFLGTLKNSSDRTILAYYSAEKLAKGRSGLRLQLEEDIISAARKAAERNSLLGSRSGSGTPTSASRRGTFPSRSPSVKVPSKTQQGAQGLFNDLKYKQKQQQGPQEGLDQQLPPKSRTKGGYSLPFRTLSGFEHELGGISERSNNRRSTIAPETDYHLVNIGDGLDGEELRLRVDSFMADSLLEGGGLMDDLLAKDGLAGSAAGGRRSKKRNRTKASVWEAGSRSIQSLLPTQTADGGSDVQGNGEKGQDAGRSDGLDSHSPTVGAELELLATFVHRPQLRSQVKAALARIQGDEENGEQGGEPFRQTEELTEQSWALESTELELGDALSGDGHAAVWNVLLTEEAELLQLPGQSDGLGMCMYLRVL